MTSTSVRYGGVNALIRRCSSFFMRGVMSALVIVICGLTPCAAQNWPSGPIKIVVPYAAGGNTDIMARLLADSLDKAIGESVIVDDRGGAGGAIGAEFVARAENDGQTLLFGTTAQISVVPFVQHVRYDSATAFAPISIYGTNPDILAVSAQLPVNSVAELIAYAKSHPNEINYGSGGVGSIAHLAAATFAKRAGIEMQHIPFRGGSQTITELMAGHIQMYLGNTSEILPMAGASEIKLLAVSSKERLRGMPDLPTIGETIPGYVIDTWNGLLAPAGTPKSVIDHLEAASMQAAKDPEVIAKLFKLGIAAQGTSAAEFQKDIETERQFYRDAVATAGISAQ
jgi:tripartite-type tricarboxylate transporter receptor subunit TctC